MIKAKVEYASEIQARAEETSSLSAAFYKASLQVYGVKTHASADGIPAETKGEEDACSRVGRLREERHLPV